MKVKVTWLPTRSCTLVLGIQGFLYVEMRERLVASVEVPIHTDARIRELCNDLGSVRTDADVERLLSELREALREHILLARNSLEARMAVVSAIQRYAKQKG
jgi:vacuolar-type H+-ATPase subunit D/Vma8